MYMQLLNMCIILNPQIWIPPTAVFPDFDLSTF